MLRVRGKCVATNNRLAPPAPVILGLVPRIFWQRVSNLVNKFALLLYKYWLREDTWDKPKYDWCWRRMLNFYCMFFKYPSPDAKASPSPARGEGYRLLCRCTPRNDGASNGEGLPRPWCDKILGTDCASRPRMTGGRDANSSGRSMIEMLGVLAIIGVLSVGGIAGYSKAMEKFKVNKWVDDVVTLIANLNTTYANSKNFTEIHEKNLTDFFEELNIIPENMLDEQNRDIFGNELQISSHIPSRSEFGSRFFLYFWTLPNNDSFDECKALFDIAAQYEGSWAAVLNETESGQIGGTYSVCGKSAPDSYAEWINCQPYNTADIAQNCAVCSKQNCDINLIIHNGI